MLVDQHKQTWLKIAKHSRDRSDDNLSAIDYDVIVMGAGIAGASAAFRFAEAGYRVAVLEKEEMPAMAGSGNIQGMLYLKMSPNTPDQNELLIAGLWETLKTLKLLTARNLLQKGIDWDDCGLIQLSKSDKHREKQQELANMYPEELLYMVTQEEASHISGADLTSGGLFFPASGWVSPKKLVNALLSHSNITVKNNHEVTSISESSVSEETSLWEIHGKFDRSYRATFVILAMADQVRQLSQCETIPFTVVRGQTTSIQKDCGLSAVVSGEGYIAPSIPFQGITTTTFGATFHRHQPAGSPTDSEHLENIEMLQSSSPKLVERLDLVDQVGLTGLEEGMRLSQLEGRASTRASAMGSLPIVGPIADRTLFLERFKALRLDAKAEIIADIPWKSGLYLSTAHGSRGMITSLISADIIYRYIHGDLAEQYSESLLVALHPNRFYYRELRFNQ